MKTALLIGRKNGAGLDQDAQLIAGVLREAGWAVRHRGPREWRGLFSKKADVVIHLERVFPLWRGKAAVNVLIPNQERFPHRHLGRLKHVDHVLCKTAHALDIFTKLHRSAHLIGFTSPDRRMAGVRPDYGRCFHLAGRSTVKGTSVVVDAWIRHPEWPELVLVQHPDNAPASVPANVRLLSRVVPDGELRELQSGCGIHICPSRSEGWGHYLVEAMSCGAVVVTTDGPPMNELVRPDRGVLVPFAATESRHLGTDYVVETDALEQAISALLEQPMEGKEELGRRARAWFEGNDLAFKKSLVETINRFVG